MDVVSVCPFRVASLVWQPRASTSVLIVAVRGTFELFPDKARLAAKQEAASELDQHRGLDAARSLFAPSDLAPFKPRADVVLVGRAFAPGKVPVRSLRVRLTVGAIDKSIDVVGPPFATMALDYEHAAGGPQTTNPVGVRADAPPGANGQVPLPSLWPPGAAPAHRGGPIEPVGFGPVAPHWPIRVEALGRHAAGWPHGNWHRQPLPEDVDRAYFNAAPRDQQLDGLRDDERIILENLHPDHPRLVTALPGLHPRAFLQRPGGPVEDLAMTCDTLWIDTDRSLCTLTWRGRVILEEPAQAGRVLVAMEPAGQRISWANVERLVAMMDRERPAGDATKAAPAGERTSAPLDARAPALPFVAAGSPPPVGPRAPVARVEPAVDRGRAALLDDGTLAPLPEEHPRAPAMPFAPGPVPRKALSEDRTLAPLPGAGLRGPAMPFERSSSARTPARAALSEDLTLAPLDAERRRPATPFERPAAAPAQEEPPVPPPPIVALPPAPIVQEPPLPPPEPAVAPPVMPPPEPPAVVAPPEPLAAGKTPEDAPPELPAATAPPEHKLGPDFAAAMARAREVAKRAR